MFSNKLKVVQYRDQNKYANVASCGLCDQARIYIQ